MVSPATVVAATRSVADSNLRCRDGEWFRLQNATTPRLQRFRISWGQFGNRCKDFPENNLLRAAILDFGPRLENHCKIFPRNTLQRAAIPDFMGQTWESLQGKPQNRLVLQRYSASDPNLRRRHRRTARLQRSRGVQAGGRMARRRHNPK